MHRLATPIFIALLTTAAPAAAQLTIPPSAPRPERPEYVPLSERQQQSANPGRPAFDPSSIDFKPIYTIADDGSIIHPAEHYEIAAVRNNPLVDEELWEFIEVLLEEREEELAIIAHQYPNQAIQAITSLIPNFDITKESTRVELAEVTSVLTQPTGLIPWLAEQGILTQEMVAMSQHIATDYTQATMQHITANAPEGASADDITSLQARFLVKSGIAEALYAFGRLAREVIENNPEIVDNPDELLAKQGREFVDAAAYALKPVDDEKLNTLFEEAYNN